MSGMEKNPDFLNNLSEKEREAYFKISGRIKELEFYIESMSKEIQIKSVRQKISEAEKMLKSNTVLMYFLFGEGMLRQ